MTLYQYKMLSEDEQWDTVFSKGKFLDMVIEDNSKFVPFWERKSVMGGLIKSVTPTKRILQQIGFSINIIIQYKTTPYYRYKYQKVQTAFIKKFLVELTSLNITLAFIHKRDQEEP